MQRPKQFALKTEKPKNLYLKINGKHFSFITLQK